MGFWKTRLSSPRERDESIMCLCRLSWGLWFTPEGKTSPLLKCTFLNASGVAWFTAGLCQCSHKIRQQLELSRAGRAAGPAETHICWGWAGQKGLPACQLSALGPNRHQENAWGTRECVASVFQGKKIVGGGIILLSQIPNSLQTCKVSGSCFTFILTFKEGWSWNKGRWKKINKLIFIKCI